MAKASPKKWIQGAVKKPGALRETLGAKKGQPIPKAKLAAAAKQPGKTGQRARLAQTLGKMNKPKKFADGGLADGSDQIVTTMGGGALGGGRAGPMPMPRSRMFQSMPPRQPMGTRLADLVANQRGRLAQLATQRRGPAPPTPAPPAPTPAPTTPAATGAFTPEQIQQIRQLVQPSNPVPASNDDANWQSMGNKRGGLIRANKKVKKRG